VDGENGFIVAKRDPAALADKAITLVRDPALRAAMGRAGRRLYEEKFTEQRMVASLAHAFQAVLARHRAGGHSDRPGRA
jgi:glycosyltransferase involved in cell wall biosynthesis